MFAKIVDRKRIVRKYKNKFRIFKIGGREYFILQFSNCDLSIEEFLQELSNLLKQMKEDNIDCAYVALCCDTVMKCILEKILDYSNKKF